VSKVIAVVNPNSANASTGREWPSIEAALKAGIGGFDVRFTSEPHDATAIVVEALREGYETIISVGGDGTNNEIVNGFFKDDEPINPNARLGIICRGTGADLIKTLKIPKDPEQAAGVIARGRTKRIDVGRLTFRDHVGAEVRRHFVNIASFGMGGAVDERVNRTTKVFGGFVSFLWATFITFFTYRNPPVSVTVDGGAPEEMKITNIAVANGRYFGGGMMVAPKAEMDDGLFDVIFIGTMTVPEALGSISQIYKGTHLDHPKVRHMRGKRVEATSSERVLLDVDGEQPGMLPASFEIVPSAIEVLV